MWEAFWELGSDRAVTLAFQGMTGIPHRIFGAIPFAAIDRYATRFGIVETDEFTHFAVLIGEMDAAWRALANAKT